MSDFVVTADDRVELAFLSERGEVGCVLAQGIEALLRVLAIDTAIASDLVDTGLEYIFRKTGLLEDGGNRGVLDEGGKDVILGDVGVVHRFP